MLIEPEINFGDLNSLQQLRRFIYPIEDLTSKMKKLFKPPDSNSTDNSLDIPFNFLRNNPKQYPIPSSCPHFQCANSLTLGPLKRFPDSTIIQQPLTVKNLSILGLKPDVSKSNQCYEVLRSRLPDSVLCITSKYGYIALGTDSGHILGLDAETFKPIFSFVQRTMTNSVQIHRMACTEDDADEDEFVYSLVVADNDGRVWVFRLPTHEEFESGESVTVLLGKIDIPCAVNCAKVSPDGRIIAACCDEQGLYFVNVPKEMYGKIDMKRKVNTKNSGVQHLDGNPVQFEAPQIVALEFLLPSNVNTPAFTPRHNFHMPSLISMQYLSWSCDSRYFAVSSDSHDFIFIVEAGTMKIIKRLRMGDSSLAIEFHPTRREIFAVTNSIGFVHIFDISAILEFAENLDITNMSDEEIYSLSPPAFREIIAINELEKEEEWIDIEDDDDEFVETNESETIVEENVNNQDRKDYIADSKSLDPINDETTAERLIKIHGIQWSSNGQLLYVSLPKGVLVYQTKYVPTLMELCKNTLIGEKSAKGIDHLPDAQLVAEFMDDWDFDWLKRANMWIEEAVEEKE
ncbi:hypothetical protein HK098_005112 [Nowakowskiella sp. JEL0407]|nr:hypothetical protein HK098_005112 [Nowakowskiella sp. JEL0407]